jgi:hypothetical protein
MRTAVACALLVAAGVASCFPRMPEVRYGTCADAQCDDGTTCVENHRSDGEPYAACAIGGVEDPKCGRDQDVSFCEDNTWVRCRGRYRIQNLDCGSEHCVEAGASATCVPNAEPDPACDANAKNFAYCDGNDVVACFGSYANERTDCAFRGRLCREGHCVVSPDPDPRCSALAPGERTFCDGDVAVQCIGAFHEQEHDCARGGLRCVDRGFSVECAD